MPIQRLRLLVLFVALGCLACDSKETVDDPAPPATVTSTEASPSTSPPTPTATQTADPTPQSLRQDIQATRLAIPRLGIDAPVQASHVIPYMYTPPVGCRPRPEDTSTLSVPNQGIATPVEDLEGMENKAWIYGHSRWLGAPGIFFALGDINRGDELFVAGVDRSTGELVERKRFTVDALYLADMDSGETIVTARGPEDLPTKPLVILQTSVREDGHGKPWILDRGKLLAKATNLVEGDLDDPCKYLLLFVVASAA